MNSINKPLTVIDFFCGAGGFSEGFRQQNFKIVMGVDNWSPAVQAHNLNHRLDDKPMDILKFEGKDSIDTELIDELPNIDIIIGSPPCVLFSMANKAGKADKSVGIRLIKTYFRIIAIKKYQKGSILKAWLMENVPNSRHYVKESYTFKELNLEGWAKKNGLSPGKAALRTNGVLLNASEYGAPQNRSRFVCGEMTKDGSFPMPPPTNTAPLTLKRIRPKLPSPNSHRSRRLCKDPNYVHLVVPAAELTDHFYDTGLYITQWEQAKYLKTMHPFMGRMSFPENENKPSRTITATRSVSTREALIYKSEYGRKGNGEYRLPTIREAASLMGYPYTYQFVGSEATKWKLIGNSVSPQLSAALAKVVLERLARATVSAAEIDFSHHRMLYKQINNLNTFNQNKFDQVKIRKPGARFRRTLHKESNTTIDLMNYSHTHRPGRAWYAYAFYGTGKGHQYDFLDEQVYRKINLILSESYDGFDKFLDALNNTIGNRKLDPAKLQKTYETDYGLRDKANPLVVIDDMKRLVDQHSTDARVSIKGLKRDTFSLRQALYMFSLTYIIFDNIQSGQLVDSNTVQPLALEVSPG